MSLPFLLRATVESIPNQVPYLRASSDTVTAWAGRLKSNGRKRVGLAWAGNASHTNDRRRSCPPEHFAALSQLDGIDFYRLQMPREVRAPPGMVLIDHTEELKNFNDTAGLIANLDLIVSVDTGVAHLSGAMGKPLWIILPFAAEWRWMDKREDSPWYPTAKLFRQTSPGDWPGVLNRVRAALLEIR